VRRKKGIERPLQLYRVVRPSGMRGRFPAMAAMRGMTPFVGREDELRSLLNRWQRVRGGEGQVVTIIGEGGSANHAWWAGLGRAAQKPAWLVERTGF
jgi:hypothetical protein